jgi:predicted MPP superfamily phosphohydrolase
VKTVTAIFISGILFILLVDLLFYRVTRSRLRARWTRWLYWSVSLLFVAGIVGYHAAMPRLTGPGAYFWMGRGMLLLLLYYLPRCSYLAVTLLSLFLKQRPWIKRTAAILAALTFFTLLYSTTIGRYQYQIVHVEVEIPGLPAAFNELRVVQLTDLHLGSYGKSYPGIRKMVEKVNALQPDVVVITGDVINNFAPELLPWIDALRKINARLGKYAVTGNHDHGDYTRWPSPEAKEANLRRFFQYMEASGFRMLNDANQPLAIGEDTLYICGVRNWRKAPLPSYGNVERALQGTDGHVVVLLSHDPAYWREEVIHHPVALTLSGHTHAMQMGIQIGNYRWTPAKYFFPEYNGLYARDDKQLYVSRGIGYLGFPGRIGMRPEITVLQLTHSKR